MEESSKSRRKDWPHLWKKGFTPPGAKVWKKGQSGNPNGRRAFPEAIKKLKNVALEEAIKIIYDRICDPVYVASLDPGELDRLIEITFDRFGLPKTVKSEIKETGSRLVILRSDAKADKGK